MLFELVSRGLRKSCPESSDGVAGDFNQGKERIRIQAWSFIFEKGKATFILPKALPRSTKAKTRGNKGHGQCGLRVISGLRFMGNFRVIGLV